MDKRDKYTEDDDFGFAYPTDKGVSGTRYTGHADDTKRTWYVPSYSPSGEITFVEGSKDKGSTPYYGGSTRYSSYRSGGSYLSPSSYWRDRVSSYDYGMGKTESEDARLRKALHSLARTVNIVENDHKKDGESPLSLSWSKGDNVNDPRSRTVYLAPTLITDGKAADDSKHIDILTGKALILSAMKRTMHPASFDAHKGRTAKAFKRESKDEHTLALLATPIWQAREVIKARLAVISEWVGFAPYFEVYEHEITSGHKDAVIQAVTSAPTHPATFANMVAWNLMNHHDPITPPILDLLPAEMQDAIKEQCGGKLPNLDALMERVASLLMTPVKASGEFALAEQAAAIILKALPFPPEEEDSEDSEDSEDEGDEGDGEGGGGSDGTPDFMDADLFGRRVDGGETPMERAAIKLDDDSLKADNPANPYDYEEGDQSYTLREVGMYRLSVDDPSFASGYKELVSQNRALINGIRRVLSFRNTKITRYVHGRSEGELDDGSLHKLGMDNPTIWSSKEQIAKPSVAITLLIDESGSMQRNGRCYDAKTIAVVLTEVLRGMPGVNLTVTGHTGHLETVSRYSWYKHAKTLRPGKQLVLRELYNTKYHKNPHALMFIDAIRENLDGFAIEAAAKRMKEDFPRAQQHIVIHISDGMPCPSSAAQCRAAVDKCISKLGVEVFAIGVDRAYDDRTGERLYGKGRSVVIRDVLGALPILTPFLKKRLSKV